MYVPFKKVVFRFPRFAVEVIEKALTDAGYFEEVIRGEAFKEAIYHASPVLYTELLKYTDGTLPEKKRERVKSSLTRYLSRMSTRCTPFALFAACSVGSTGKDTALRLTEQIHISARLDMLYLCSLSQKLSGIEEVRKAVRYFVNSSLYEVAGKLRYIEYMFNIQKRNYRLIEVAKTPLLSLIVKEARRGATMEELAEKLMGKYEVDKEDAFLFVEDIIKSQILVSEIDPIITGSDFYHYLLAVLERIGMHSETYDTLMEIKRRLLQIRKEDPENIAVCDRIEEEIKKLGVPYQKKFLLQIDSLRKVDKAVVGEEVILRLQEYMLLLNKLCPNYGNGQLMQFRDKFRQRYEEQEVPLLEVLDPELGIGYLSQRNDVSPLIAGLRLPARAGNQQRAFYSTPLGKILLKKMLSAERKGDTIEITEEDVKELTANWDNLPPTLAAKFQLLDGADTGEAFTLSNVAFSGNSAANMLGRFAYCDTEIDALVREITEAEKKHYQDYIVAEISHIPDTRVGNVLARPNFRDYEIVYLSNTMADPKAVIYPSDIRVSVVNGKIALRSVSLNKYLIPRLSTAHNYNLNPTPVYKFLCDLQEQDVRSSLYFSWGELESQFDYLPRVVYKNIICSPAMWKLEAKDFARLLKEGKEVKLLANARKLREKHHLPESVNLVDSDNKLRVELENVDSLRAFAALLANRTQIVLEETELHPYPVMDALGRRYANECILPFLKQTSK